MTDIFKPNLRTQKIIEALVKIIKASEFHNKKMVIGSGVAIEIEAGVLRGDENLTRNHEDLDLLPLEEDISFWKEWFTKNGYKISGNSDIKDNAKAFVASSPIFYVDVYGIYIDPSGALHTRQSGVDDNWELKWDEAFIKCRWHGFEVFVTRHKIVLGNKRVTAKEKGTPLREKDLHDHKLFNADPTKVGY